MPQFNLFGEIDEPIRVIEPEPEIKAIPYERKKRIIGDNFVVVKCFNCTQLILVDPEYYDLDLYQDKICECCNEKYQEKYMRFLKLKIR